MLQQKYNWILNGCRSLQLRLISELRGLCCYVGKPDPWSLYSTTDPDPMACDPSSRRCDSWSHPIFLLLIPDPIYLVTTLSIYKMRLTEEKRYKNFWDSMCWECATGRKRKEDGKPCVTNFLWKNFPPNVTIRQTDPFLKDQKTLMLSSRQTRN